MEPCPVHVEGRVAELVQDREPRLGHVCEQPVERPLPLGLAELQHQLRGLPESRGRPAEVAAIPRAVAMRVLPRPVRPQKTRSPASRTNASKSISSRPQPSGNATSGQ